jgi:hypothetical protein
MMVMTRKEFRMRRILLAVLIVLNLIVSSLLVSPPSGVMAVPLIGPGCTSERLIITEKGHGSGIADMCLKNITIDSDGTITADLEIKNKKAVFYNLSFVVSSGVSLTLKGRNLFDILEETARKLGSKTALFPIAGHSTLTLPRIKLPPGGQLRFDLKKFGDEPIDALSLATFDLAAAFASVASGIDPGKAVSGDPETSSDFAAKLLTSLNNVGFDLAAFTLKLKNEDYRGALEALAKAIKDAPEILAPLIGLTNETVAQLAGDIAKLLDAIEVIPFIFDFFFAPLSGGFEIRHPAPTTTAVDLAFVIDTTGSMGDDIDAVKAAANEIINLIKFAAPNSRIAVVDFRDFPSRGASYDYPYRDALAFTGDGTVAKNAINGLSLGFGGDGPETLFCALMHTMKNDRCAGQGASTSIGGWRRDTNAKFVIYMTDAPALSPEPFTGFTIEDVKRAAQEGGFDVLPEGGAIAAANSSSELTALAVPGVHILPVVVGGNPVALAQATELADATDGAVFAAATAGDVVAAIREALAVVVTPPDPAPTCATAAPSPGLLWPPNNAFAPIQIQGVAHATSLTITSIRQDEPTGKATDGRGVGTGTAHIRAERDGKGDGRVYHIAFAASGPGGSCDGLVKMIVPHDMGVGQRARGTAGDGGPLHDSTKVSTKP